MSEMGWRKMRNYMAMVEEMTGCLPEAEVYRKKLGRVYVGDAKAIVAGATPADVGECPNSYVFIVDMPGMKASEIMVRVEENGNVLMVSGERKRDKDHNKESKGDRIKYVKMERIGKFARKFGLHDNANVDAISALYKDGVLTVTVQKLPPPQPKRPKTIQVKVA